MKVPILVLSTVLLLPTACTDPFAPGSVVPATVAENPALQHITIVVDGVPRRVHYEILGEAGRPLLLILHGSLSDMRAYRPLAAALADQYRVVIWDQRGSGLSERVGTEELGIRDMVEEIDRIVETFSPVAPEAGPVRLIGHSWSAVFVARYLAEHPERVSQAVLMEPIGMTSDAMAAAPDALNLFTERYLQMVYSSRFLTPLDHEALDYRMLAMLKSGVRDFFCDASSPPPWPVRRVGGLALLTWEAEIIGEGGWSYDFSPGLLDFSGEVLLVGSSCSPIGADFQENWNAPFFRNAQVLTVQDAGHRLLTEQFDRVVDGIRSFFDVP